MLTAGDLLQGRYRILREIGAGGMGTVYEGENLLIRRRVAIKVMREEAVEKPDLCARFELEAQIASQIPSDHITEVLDLGELDGGQRFIVMEYLVGESLAARLERSQRLAPPELLGLVRQVLVALGAAHGAGVIHRDVKPDNVFILNEKAGRRDFVKLLDFGISKLRPGVAETPLTQSGMFVGTPSYMAPEQVGGTPASPLWDLYAVGVILYRGLTGETPYQSQGVHELVYKVAMGTFARPSQRIADLDPGLDALVCKAMARLPEQRFQSAEQFIGAIDSWLAAREDRVLSSRGAERTPRHRSGALVATSRMPAPLAATGLSQPAAPTRASTLLGVSARRRAAGWLKWAAAGALMALAAAVVVSRRWAVDVPTPTPLVETRAMQPAPHAAAPPVAPAPAQAPTPAVAPVPAIAVAPVTAGGSTLEANSPAEGGGGARHGAAAPALPKSSPAARPGASRGKPRAPVAAAPAAQEPSARSDDPDGKPASAPTAPQKIEPRSHGDDPGAKPRPDWGY